MEMSSAAMAARREYQNQWAKNNRERRNASQKRWREKNPEKIKAANRRYWEKRAQKASEFQEIPVAAARLERDTIDSLNKMMGYNEPEQHEVDTTITVEFGDGVEDFAV